MKPVKYRIARLRRDKGIRLHGPDVSVDLDAISLDDHITNDADLLDAQHGDTFFYLSGGGTLLINGRYLLVVRREDSARINPGKLSLFTGRADDAMEWEQPWRIVRELFEELVLFQSGAMLLPVCTPYQTIIDSIYQNAGRNSTGGTMDLNQISLANGTLTVSRGSRSLHAMPAFFHINSRNDINLLYIFAADLDMARLTALDGENDQQRPIAALDIVNMELTYITSGLSERGREDASGMAMTEHLEAAISMLRTGKA